MALRVLLADESSTIKKVISLSLHDYGVEVKAVPVGIDVMAVAEAFNPDLVLIDILLPKKSGYDVCKELKTSAKFSKTPVIMMWSGFMDIDETKMREANPDAKIEKPFDSETLRQMVQNLVPKTQTNPVSAFVQFPKLPEFKESSPLKTPPPPPPPMPTEAVPRSNPPPPPSNQGFDGDSLTQSLINSDSTDILSPENGAKPASSEDVWSQFNLPTAPASAAGLSNPEDADFLNLPEVPEDDFKIKSIDSSDNFEEIQFDTNPPPVPMESKPAQIPAQPERAAASAAIATSVQQNLHSSHGGSLPQEMTERIIREEARIIIEKICWEILPGIAERVIKDEINKLLKDTEKSI